MGESQPIICYISGAPGSRGHIFQFSRRLAAGIHVIWWVSDGRNRRLF